MKYRHAENKNIRVTTVDNVTEEQAKKYLAQLNRGSDHVKQCIQMTGRERKVKECPKTWIHTHSGIVDYVNTTPTS